MEITTTKEVGDGLKDALGSVLDLASQNILDPDDPGLDDVLKAHAKDQAKCINMVNEFYKSL